MNCLLYARVSTDKQAEKELSIPAQLAAMRDYAQQHGWTIVSEFVEPGASAKTTERPELQRLLETVKHSTTPVHVVLVHKIDRLARNVYDHAMIKALLTQRSVRLASVVENVDESVSGELIENIMASIAQFYSANLSEEVKKGMRQKVMHGGWPHRPPRGYLLTKGATGKATAIEVHSKDGPLMKRAFELYATGWYSIRALSQRLWKDGLTARGGGPVPQAHLRQLLSSSFYAGCVRWHEMECPGLHPALITRELFDKVQHVIEYRFRNPGLKGSVIPGFPLRGLAICASCRGRMTAERHGKWQYYRCSRQTYRRELCSARLCNAVRAHAGLKRVCQGIRIDASLADEIADAAKRLIVERVADMAQRRESLKSKEGAILNAEMQLAASFRAGDIAPNVFRAQSAVLRKQRQELGDLAAAAPVTADALAEAVGRMLRLATSCWDLYESINDAQKTALLRTVFDSVVLDHEGIVGFTLRKPFDAVVSGAAARTTPSAVATAILDAA
jgi:DNA invertase Pin-like site-specific DNA recombinase